MAAASAVQRAAFLEMMVPLVLEQVKKHDGKIFASVALAQAIKESGWGTSTKMIRANAVYGIKVGNTELVEKLRKLGVKGGTCNDWQRLGLDK